MNLFKKENLIIAIAIMAIFSLATFCGGDKGAEGDSATAETSGDPDIAKGMELYANNGCAGCHGDSGLGDGPAGSALNPKPRDFSMTADYKQGTSADEVAASIEKGVPGTPMIGYAAISPEDRMLIAKYIVSLQK
ncbi:MAG: c-type cytochrome [Spirochaetia bacterium]|nr:c-type cytochrome [Spirochaetia bacterium]